MDINQHIATYTSIFESLKKTLRRKVNSNQLLMAIAAAYMSGKHEFDDRRFLSIADSIKKQAKPLSIWRSQSRFSTAAMIDVQFENATEKIPQLFELYDQLIEAKFHRGAYTCIAAATLLTLDKDNNKNMVDVIGRSKAIYQDMKSEHLFLTSAEDYPIAVALAFENQENIIQDAEKHYQHLHRNGFRKGNHLQFLSHILALGQYYTGLPLDSNTVEVFDAFKTTGMKSKPVYYPFMGMLALLPDTKRQVKTVNEIYTVLNKQKHFKWQKDLNVMIAAGMVVKEHLNNHSVVDTSLFTIMETILQTQQAALTAAAVSSAAASNSSN